ncbi:MAG TPA: trypsin-like peptidase domain-containing protein, partial [Gammaproteobacteria bacterium]|nr:trypsin-like peptidase domain-containing protein [Gammaproteobacteria bacterium]
MTVSLWDRRGLSKAALALSVLLAVTGCSDNATEGPQDQPSSEASDNHANAAREEAAPAQGGVIARVAARNRPAVVNVGAIRSVPATGGEEDQGDQPLEEFFRRFFGGDQSEPRYESRSLGSGFIIRSDGYIVTNAHVVAKADQILVQLHDRRQLQAELVGEDQVTDLALLKVDASGLPTVSLATNDDIQVGEWVVAMGSPFGFDSSVTAGIVSAKGRSLPGMSGAYVPFLQTDVAINPGNSGGPLFNLDGQVVGVNSQIYSRSGGYMGLSFAIPAQVVSEVTRQLREDGEAHHGWLGVSVQTVTERLAGSLDLKEPRGGVVSRVVDGGPAAEAGLRTGDVILKVEGHEIEVASDIPPLVGSKQP